jgi:hypothetical protein
MDYKITKLDRRHSGSHWYKYSVSPVVTLDKVRQTQLLIEARNWMWATYGPSAELGAYTKDLVWAWDTEHGNRRIYLKSDEEMTFFKLKYGG